MYFLALRIICEVLNDRFLYSGCKAHQDNRFHRISLASQRPTNPECNRSMKSLRAFWSNSRISKISCHFARASWLMPP